MTPPITRGMAALSWFAAAAFLGSVLLPFVAEAQGTSNRMRAASRPPAKQTVRAPAPWVSNPAVSARDAYLIVDAQTGRELTADRPDEARHPASLTKLMTIYMTFNALDRGKLALGDLLPVSAQAVSVSPTKMGVPLGGTVTVRDAVMGLVTRSANDAAVVIAEALAGDEASFAVQMTRMARQLGMSSTLFKNASGLPDREQVTTARDMARLAHALLRDFPHYYPIFSVQTYFYRGRPMENHNRMLGTYAGADGFKTGYTQASGFNLVMSANRDGRRLIGVVMGGNTAFTRDRLMAELMDQGFDSARQMSLAGFAPFQAPTAARYNAAHFGPGAVIPEPPARVVAVPAAAPAPRNDPPRAEVAAAPLVPLQVNPPAFAQDPPAPPIGTWVIQVGSFGDSRAAMAALDRAIVVLPELRTRTAVSVDEVQMAAKTFHRARLTNLSQEDAMEGCRKLEKRKIYCSALQVTAWNTPGAK